MIKRDLQNKLVGLSKQYPVVTLTGPRQSGKTTLCKMAFPDMAYASLEEPQTQQFAISDPKGFLGPFDKGVILDEIQRAPELLSYIQVIVDEQKKNGLYIITGSQNLLVSNAINQSLAGRTAILKLLPFSISEISNTVQKMKIDELLLRGFYPRIYDQKLNPTEAMGFYCETYVERDVRSIVNIKNLSTFRKFLKLCAGRTGQLLDLTSLGNDVGITHTTVREWISILEASYIIFLLQPYHRNFNKRNIKSPKLYFYDVGLAAYLLGIEAEQQMIRDPLRGNLFENMIVAEFIKQRFNEGKSANFFFFRDSNGNEVDLIADYGDKIFPIEIKSGQTITNDYFKGVKYIKDLAGDKLIGNAIVYGGASLQERTDTLIYPYQRCGDLYKKFLSV